MAAETELESIVVRLTGDSTGLERMLLEATSAVLASAAEIQRSATQIEGITGAFAQTKEGLASMGQEAEKEGDRMEQLGVSLNNVGTVISGVNDSFKDVRKSIQAGIAAYAAFRGVVAITKDFSEQEDAERKLTATLEANGREVESLNKRYAEFASTIQDTTTVADEHVLSLLTLAEQFGMTGKAAEDAVKAAIGLEAAFGIGPQRGIRAVNALAQGNASQLRRLIPPLRGVKDDTEVLAKANKILEQSWGLALSETSTFSGSLKQLKNAFSEVMEEVGKTIAEGVQPLVEAVKGAVDWFRKLEEPARTWVKWILVILATMTPLIATFIALKPLFATIFGPTALIVGGIIAAIALWIDYMGGLEEATAALGEAWKVVKKFALDFWEWLKPVVETTVAVVKLAWRGIKEAISASLDAIKESAKLAFEKIPELVSQATSAVVTFVQANASAITVVAAVTGAILLSYGAYQLLSFAIVQVNALLTFLGVKQLFIIALLTAWKVLVLVAQGVMALFNIQLVIWNSLLVTGTFWIGVWSVAVKVAHLASLLWSFAVGAATTSLAAQNIVAAIGTTLVWLWNAAMVASNVVMAVWVIIITGAMLVAWLLDAALTGNLLTLIASTAATLASSAAMLVWKGSILLAKGMTWLWNAALAAKNLLLAGSATAAISAALSAGAYSLAAIGAKVATWLWNAALTVMNVLLAGIPLVIGLVAAALGALALALLGASAAGLALAGTIALLTVGFVAISSVFSMIGIAAVGIWEAATGIADELERIPTTVGPLKAVSDVFMEWWDIIQDVVRAAKVDMPLAWSLLKATAVLAIAQVKALWPPLWDYIQRGFIALWDVAVLHIEVKFAEIIPILKAKLLSLPKDIGTAFDVALKYMKARALEFAGLLKEGEAETFLKTASNIEEVRTKSKLDQLKVKLKTAQENLDTQLKRFDEVKGNEEIEKARAEVERLRALIPEAERLKNEEEKKAQDMIDKLKLGGGQIGDNLAKGAKEGLGKFDAALKGSAEAFSRVAAFKESLAGGKGEKGQKPTIGETPSTGGIPLPPPPILSPEETKALRDAERNARIMKELKAEEGKLIPRPPKPILTAEETKALRDLQLAPVSGLKPTLGQASAAGSIRIPTPPPPIGIQEPEPRPGPELTANRRVEDLLFEMAGYLATIAKHPQVELEEAGLTA